MCTCLVQPAGISSYRMISVGLKSLVIHMLTLQSEVAHAVSQKAASEKVKVQVHIFTFSCSVSASCLNSRLLPAVETHLAHVSCLALVNSILRHRVRSRKFHGAELNPGRVNARKDQSAILSSTALRMVVQHGGADKYLDNDRRTESLQTRRGRLVVTLVILWLLF